MRRSNLQMVIMLLALWIIVDSIVLIFSKKYREMRISYLKKFDRKD